MDNLLSNALKYSPKQSTVIVKASSEGDKTLIWVEDNGPGLSKEEQNRLFDKFSKLSPKPTSNESSTGLGLYIVKKFIDAMKGRVWCESEPGKGSVFIVELPNRASHKFTESELN
jgi:signal transduction histidine kinase